METATHTHPTGIQVNTYDPTRTTVLRNGFAREMRKRFRELTVVIRTAIIEEDCFGLNAGFYQMNPPGRQAFVFPRSADKVNAFMEWLNRQVEAGMIEVKEFQQVGTGIEGAWTNKYIQDSYKRGVIRARYELQKAGFDVPSIDQTGGINISMSTPFHMDRVGLLYSRTFSGLKGITAQMDTQISRVLAQGMADGDNPRLLARKLVSTINGTGMGELGLTDTLGRFIPASRRAEILARTEIIRAHHNATIQEYRNWGAEGVKVKAEFVTAGDDRVCDRCNALEREVFTLDRIEGMIPLHPQCFMDPQIPIYTSKGWKPIGNIEIGDFVLTHKHCFRKVTATIRNRKQSPEVVRFKFKGDLHLSMTANHQILASRTEGDFSRWREAGKCVPGDHVNLLANRCKRCGKLIPYFRKYCSRTCLSLDITDKQWSNPEHRKSMSKKASEQLHREYANGTRDKIAITKGANKKIRQMVEDGTFGSWMDDVFFEKMKQATNTPEMRETSSKRMETNNPMNDPIVVAKVQKSLQDLFKKFPEKRLNARMAKHKKSGKMTWIEKRMSILLDKLRVEYVFQYPILRYNVDFAIPALKIIIECDGNYWHQDKEKDLIRQRKIEAEGWFVLRYSGTKINQCLEEIEGELSRVVCNHTGEYESVSWEIESVKKWKVKKPVTLYNLSVKEDESYIAKGVVVHNCRCIALPYKERK